MGQCQSWKARIKIEECNDEGVIGIEPSQLSLFSLNCPEVLYVAFDSPQPGDLVHTLGDAHVYVNHVDPLRVQLERAPKPFPKLRFKRDDITEIEDFKYDDFEVSDYKCHPKIAMEMAV